MTNCMAQDQLVNVLSVEEHSSLKLMPRREGGLDAHHVVPGSHLKTAFTWWISAENSFGNSFGVWKEVHDDRSRYPCVEREPVRLPRD